MPRRFETPERAERKAALADRDGGDVCQCHDPKCGHGETGCMIPGNLTKQSYGLTIHHIDHTLHDGDCPDCPDVCTHGNYSNLILYCAACNTSENNRYRAYLARMYSAGVGTPRNGHNGNGASAALTPGVGHSPHPEREIERERERDSILNNATQEFKKSERCTRLFIAWLESKLPGGEIRHLLDDVIHAGAKVTGCKPQTITRYLRVETSSEGEFTIEIDDDGRSWVRRKESSTNGRVN